ncbi:MAG: 50S ribosomal protein L11 [archaeon]|nr:MAG: 50S ribosomal protein L11 [archaeon]
MKIKLLVQAGAMKPGPALSQKLGPLGVNMGKVISQVNAATKDNKGMKVPVILNIDGKTKSISTEVLTPPAAELLKKEIGIKKASPLARKLKVANIPLEMVIKVAKIKEKDMLVHGLKSAVKTVLGSCVALGALVESKEPSEIMGEVDQGKFDDIINKGSEQASPEKLKKLAEDFEEVKKEQVKIEKEIAEKKAKAEEAKAAGSEPAAEKKEEPKPSK